MANAIRVVSVFSIATLILLVGFLVGQYFAGYQNNQIAETKEELLAELASIDAQYALLASEPCSFDSVGEFGKRLSTLGDQLSLIERKLGTTRELDNLKAHYFSIEIQHMLLAKQVNKECGASYVPLLYFYSNTDCALCVEQGQVLTQMKQEIPELMVYSFDVDNASPLIETLKQKFNVTSNTEPTVVVNDSKLEGLHSAEKIGGML